MSSGGGRAPIPGSAGRRTQGGSGEAQKLARVVFAVLVVACFVAFVLTQRLKHTPTPVQEFKMDETFTPTRVAAAACRGRVPPATGEFKCSDRVPRVQDRAGR